MRNIELLSPSGDMERLKLAVKFGADAIYVGGTMFGMRTNPSNFDADQLKEAVEFVHKNNKKIYLTCNTLPRNNEIDVLPDYLRYVSSIGVDALIIADMGVLSLAKKYAPDTDIHISTQAGIVNYQSANAFYEMGASRIVTARELSLDEIKTPIADEKTYEEKKEHMKAVKQQVRENAIERQQNEEAYIMLSFSSFEAKSDFCDLLECSIEDKFVKGEDVLKLIK